MKLLSVYNQGTDSVEEGSPPSFSLSNKSPLALEVAVLKS
jgi:hypothetical protein